MSKNISACLSSKSDEWRTPSNLYTYFMNNGFVDLFPFGSKQNQYDIMYRNEYLYINPPFSEINKERFFNYLVNLLNNGNTIFLLMPVRTDTKFFNKIYDYVLNIYFIKGRLRFNDSKPAPFPTMILILSLKVFVWGKFSYSVSLEELITTSPYQLIS